MNAAIIAHRNGMTAAGCPRIWRRSRDPTEPHHRTRWKKTWLSALFQWYRRYPRSAVATNILNTPEKKNRRSPKNQSSKYVEIILSKSCWRISVQKTLAVYCLNLWIFVSIKIFFVNHLFEHEKHFVVKIGVTRTPLGLRITFVLYCYDSFNNLMCIISEAQLKKRNVVLIGQLNGRL